MTTETRDRQWVTFRLWPKDRTLLQGLAARRADTKDRYSALLALVPILSDLELPDIRKRKREPLRLGIPREVHAELERVKEETGWTITDILLAAARVYAERNPISEAE